MHLVDISSRRYAQFESLRDRPGLIHAFCTRPDDVSQRYDSRYAERAARRQQMALDLSLGPHRLCFCEQVHETRIAIIEAPQPSVFLEGYDGVATAAPDMPLMTFSADCPLVLLYDPVRAALGTVHASWRCTVGQISRQLVELMRERFGCDPAHLLAGIGPGAGPCCYEVKQDVFDAAANLPERDALFAQRDGRLYFDLWRANRELLIQGGVRPENIELAGICTMCRNDLFFSFRREGAGCGHFGLMAALRAPQR